MIRQMWSRFQLAFAQGVGVMTSRDKVQVTVLDEDDVPPNVRRVEPYGYSYRPPRKGFQTYMVFPAGDRSHGLCLIIGDKRYQIDLEPGEVALHDDQGQKVHLTRNGIVIDGAGKPITVQNTPHVNFNTPTMNLSGDLNVGGNVVAQGDITDNAATVPRSMSGMRIVYNGHTHNDPQGGSVGQPNAVM